MAYIGQGIKNGTFAKLDTSGNTYNGSNVTFDLGTQVGSPVQLLVSHDGVIQNPGTDYTLASNGTQITFTTAPASGASIFIMEISGAVGGPMNRDINGEELILDVDGDTSITADTDDQIDFKAGGTDVMSMTATGLTINDGTTITTADNTDTLTLTSTDADANSGPNLRLYRNSSSPADSDKFGQIDFEGRNDNSQDFVAAQIVVNSGDVSDGTEDAQIEFDVMTAGTLREYMRFASGSQPTITFNEDSQDIDFRVESNEKSHLFFLDGGTNDGASAFNDDAPETGTGGVTLNQTSLDNLILSMKSNDIAHGVTNHQETDTYMGFLKYHATSGGGNITGCSEDDVGMFIHGFAPNPNTTQNATGVSVVMMRANDVSGAGGANVGSTGNCFGVQNGGSQVFIVRGDGNIYSDSSHNTYDAFDDAQLVRAFDLSHGKGVIDSKFDKFVSYNHEKLAELDLVGRENDGTPNHFVNVTGMQRLHNGAIWQQYEKHNQLLEAVYDLAKEAVGEEKADAILEKHEVKRLQ